MPPNSLVALCARRAGAKEGTQRTLRPRRPAYAHHRQSPRTRPPAPRGYLRASGARRPPSKRQRRSSRRRRRKRSGLQDRKRGALNRWRRAALTGRGFVVRSGAMARQRNAGGIGRRRCRFVSAQKGKPHRLQRAGPRRRESAARKHARAAAARELRGRTGGRACGKHTEAQLVGPASVGAFVAALKASARAGDGAHGRAGRAEEARRARRIGGSGLRPPPAQRAGLPQQPLPPPPLSALQRHAQTGALGAARQATAPHAACPATDWPSSRSGEFHLVDPSRCALASRQRRGA